MARLIRANSEIANVTNNDDFRILRYATGGYNGVLKNYGNECSYTVTDNNFKINSGEIFYQGVDTEILTAGETITVDNISGTQYYVIYLEIDLSNSENQTATIKSSYGTSTYPIISAGDDLTTVPSGVANFELYRFTASSGVISSVVAQFNIIEVGNALTINNVSILESSGKLQNTTASPAKIIRQIEVIDDTPFVYNTTDATMTMTFPTGKTLANGDTIEIEFYDKLPLSVFNSLDYGFAHFKIETEITTSTAQHATLANHYTYVSSVGSDVAYSLDGNMGIAIYSDKIIVTRPYRSEITFSGTTLPTVSVTTMYQNPSYPSKIYRILRIID